MNRIDNSGQGIAQLGRDEDRYMAHVAQGEMVVPPVISSETRQRIEKELRAAGLSPNEYTVGEGMSINPITGMPEFGWLKKTFKSVKKVAKKVAPVIGPLANFIPGVGPLLSAAIQAGTTKLAGGSWKDALKAGAMSYGVGKLGQGIGGLGKGTATAGNTGGNLFTRIKSGIGSYFNPAEGATGIFGGSIGPSIRGGIGSLFGGMGGGEGAGGEQELMFEDDQGNRYTASKVEEMLAAGTQPDMLKQVQSSSGFNIGRSILGKGNTPDFIKGIEDRFKGPDGEFGGGDGLFSGGGGGMGNLGAAGIAALLGKTVYDAAKERQGGLALTPAVTMDALGRYSLANALGTGGTREEFGLGPAPSSLKFNMGGPVQYFSQGGAAIKELDMRDGGESAGPGTGTSDDIPAMLSDGEFVMTAKATKGAGAFNLNKTKSGIELIKGGKASREKGVENMRELMNIFEAI